MCSFWLDLLRSYFICLTFEWWSWEKQTTSTKQIGWQWKFNGIHDFFFFGLCNLSLILRIYSININVYDNSTNFIFLHSLKICVFFFYVFFILIHSILSLFDLIFGQKKVDWPCHTHTHTQSSCETDTNQTQTMRN